MKLHNSYNPCYGDLTLASASICQALAEPLKRQLYQAPVFKQFLAFAIASGFGD